jgi:hypothetical protein
LTHFLGPQYPAQGLTQQGTQERFLEWRDERTEIWLLWKIPHFVE